jgi:ParB family transcriptional regulator, chromosome partitioning protein
LNAKKRGLGRGLDALIQKTEQPVAVTSLPLAELTPNRFQPRTRFSEEALAELAKSIRAQGLVQPIVVTLEADGAYSIIAGERRWRAARLAGLESVPVVVREALSDQDRLELALVENLQRSDLNALEEAEAYQALQEKFGLSQEQVASRVGKGRPTVTNSLRLLKLPEPIKLLLREGRLSAGQARPLLALSSSEAQERLAERAVEEQLSARELEKLVSLPEATAKGPAKAPELPESNTLAAQERLTRRLQTKVDIKRRGRGGTLQIHFHSEDELIRLYDLLMDQDDSE